MKSQKWPCRGCGKIWTSNATWGRLKEPTQDHHYTEEAAQAVCDMMIKEYTVESPCKYRGVCLKAWVEEPEKVEPKTDGQKLVEFCDRMMGCGPRDSKEGMK